MNDVTSFFAPQRARAETPAPQPTAERHAPETSGADFARSLASVRGMQRSASGQERAAVVRTTARADERSEARAEDPTSAVRTRSQVQALMLSGAMRFAATRAVDATAAPTITPADLLAGMIAANPIAEVVVTDGSLVDESTRAVDVPSGIVALSATPAGTVATDVGATTVTDSFAPVDFTPVPTATDTGSDEMLVEPAPAQRDAAVADVAAMDAAPTAEATAAAMQLVATLPIFDAPVDADVVAAPQTTEAQDERYAAAMARWESRRVDLARNDGPRALVEDHFDAPAAATSDTTVAPITLEALAESLPANVTMTFGDTMAQAADTTTPAVAVVTAPATTSADVHEVERAVTRLAPEFRDRLERVIARMKEEFGHDVTVVETVRSQARQAALYAQGRTAPGPVVTWTRNSKHSKGLAADLMVDGQWDNQTGYAHLAQIARQEGLRTLGARDPGHVELPTDGTVSPETLGSLLNDLAGDAGDNARKVRADAGTGDTQQSAGSIARVAEVAQVARVSQVAQVARVASVARPGDGASRNEARGTDNVSPLAMPSQMPQMMMDGTNAARAASPVSTVNMADRISHLMDLQAAQSARPLNSVLLRMDNAGGIEDQIRIDTRGTSVDAQLGLGSAQQAAELSTRMSELREALERRGLTADGLRVTASPRNTDSVQFTRMPAPAIDVAALRAASDAQAQSDARDQASRDAQREALARQQDRPTPRPSSDDARHRSRREQPETRQ